MKKYLMKVEDRLSNYVKACDTSHYARKATNIASMKIGNQIRWSGGQLFPFKQSVLASLTDLYDN